MQLALKLKMDPLSTDDDRWHAVAARDARFDGQFVYAVSSTRIYCRPSCPSKRPSRERVDFFPVPEAAEQAGYRACKRCRPRQARILDPQIEMVRRVCHYLDSTDAESVKLAELSQLTGVSLFHLQRTFKHIMGISPRQYYSARKFGRFKSSIKEGKNVTSALYEAGFNSSSRLYGHAAEELGMTPATYSRGGRGVIINYTIATSPIGQVLVAATDRGVCAVKIADTDGELEVDLREEFPAAVIERNDDELEDTVAKVIEALSNSDAAADLPLDIRATAFQRQVWEKLREIPYGETVSYGDVAKALGNPGAVRAVGRACATNPVALIIPCHRVVREDSSLGGYRWGIDRKKSLLELEKKSSRSK
jgi:AraC family transcriptional regulator of adaptative response/methylated-DNA-[protein]-cysteine methyltransferase